MDAKAPQRARHVDLRDVIEAMRKMTTAIELSDTSFGTVTDVRGTASAIVTPAGEFVSANATAAKLFGYSAAELVGKSLVGMAAEDERPAVLESLSRSSTGSFHSFSVALRGADGVFTPVQVYQQPIADSAGGFGTFLTIFENEPVRRTSARDALGRSQADLRHLAAHLMMAQEKERRRLSTELHDGLGQALTMIKLLVEDALLRIRRDRVDEATGLLDTTVLRIRETIGEVRQICGALRPSLLDDLGLLPALEALCREVEQSSSGLMVTFDCHVTEAELPEALKADMFRIAQESLNNAVKHASADEIRLALRRDDDALCLTIRDNGKGFAPSVKGFPPNDKSFAPQDGAAAYRPPAGLGLIGMQERVAASGGTFSVQPGGNGGTVVCATWRVPPGRMPQAHPPVRS